MAPSQLEPDIASAEALQPHNIRRYAVPALLGLFCLCFLAGALRSAARTPLWMDEILAMWVVRLPTYQQVWSAVYHGSETSPPTYHLLMHFVRSVLGDSYAVYRLPSILAALVSGLCVFALLRRYLDSAAAAYGMAFSLLGVLAWFATQARPYTFVAACFAGAVLLWDGIETQRPKIWRIAAMSALLVFAIYLHFYTTLFVPCLAAMELLWSALHRRLRISVWLGLFLAGLSSFVWLPFIRVHSSLNASDTGSLDYYAKPSFGKLLHAYADLAVFDKKQILFLAATFVILGATTALSKMRWVNWRTLVPGAPPDRASSNFYIIIICTIAFPLLVLAFALFVTKTFNLRYTLIATFGFAYLLAYIFNSVPVFRSAAGAILLAACPLAFLSAPSLGDSIPEQVLLFGEASKPYPIVVGEGRLFFEMAEALPKQIKSRLVYVNTPPGTIDPDPTNEHLVDRWHLIRPDLTVMSAPDFFAQNPHFYLFHTGSSADVITKWLLDRHLIDGPVVMTGDATLFEAEAPKLAAKR